MTMWPLISRVRALFGSRQLGADFEEELEAHIALAVDDYIRRGMTPADARRAAAIRLGGPMQLKEEHREKRSLAWVDTTLQDLRYAFRGLRRQPAFAAVAIATLAIGIGAGTSVYTVVAAVLVRPLPYAEPDRLVRIFETNPLRRWTRNVVAPANYADWRARSRTLSDIAAFEQFNAIGSGASDAFLTGMGEPQAVKAMPVSGNLFQVLGAAPMLGRAFSEDEQWEGQARVAILSYGLWQSAFGGDRAIVGKRITLSGRSYEVVGVMPRTFFFPGRDVQLWTPFGYKRELMATARRPHWLGAVARMRPGVSFAQAADEMSAIARQLEQEYPDTNTKMGVELEPLHDSFAYGRQTALLMLTGAVGLLFLIVCANIAGLQLGRGVSRAREFAIRRALGAGRGRLIRQRLVESLVLSGLGGALGLLFATAAREALVAYASSAIPLFVEVRVDWRVTLFAIALSLAAPLVFGLVPALSAARSGHVTERSEVSSRETRALRNALVAAEVALSIVLVVGALLLVRSLARLQGVDPGFDPQRAITFTVTLPPARYADNAARTRAFQEIERRLREQPSVESIGATSTLALRGFTWTADTTIEGRSQTDYERDTRHMSVTPAYFSAMGIRLLAGRHFAETDTRDKAQVTIVNASLARRYFPGLAPADVIGKRVTFGRPQDNAPWVTIIGVIADEKQDGLDRPAEPTEYSTITQRIQNPLTFVMRTGTGFDAALATANAQLHEVDKDLALTQVATLEEVVDRSTADARFRTTLLAAFAGMALFLAALGIYGVLAYFVSQRSRELGIRLALGAKPSAVFALVVHEGMRPVLAGAAAGFAGAMALTTLMRSLLFEVQPVDPVSYACTIALLCTTAAVGCALPAWRATRVDPVEALRVE
jgi:predicted permease